MPRVRFGWLAGAAVGLAALASPRLDTHSGRADAAPPAKAEPHDGPFGIAMGEPISELGPVTDVGKGQYTVLRPPRPNPLFPTVSVFAYPETGVCLVFGSSDLIDLDPQGQKVKRAVDEAAEVLATKYGPGAKQEQCNGDPQECQDAWTIKLSLGEAQYAYGWLFAGRPDHIGTILVEADAEHATQSRVNLGYRSTATDACEAAAAAAKASGL